MLASRSALPALVVLLFSCLLLPGSLIAQEQDLGEFKEKRDEIRRRYLEARKNGDRDGARIALEELKKLDFEESGKEGTEGSTASGSGGRLGRYCDTVRSLALKPSFVSSARILCAPRRSSSAIRRSGSRTSRSIRGRPDGWIEAQCMAAGRLPAILSTGGWTIEVDTEAGAAAGAPTTRSRPARP